MGEPLFDWTMEISSVFIDGKLAAVVVQLKDDWDRLRWQSTVERRPHQTVMSLLSEAAGTCGRHMLSLTR